MIMIIMIICLTWFPSRRFRRTLHIPKYGGFYKNVGILLEAIIGDSYSITFGDGLVTVKPQPVTSN